MSGFLFGISVSGALAFDFFAPQASTLKDGNFQKLTVLTELINQRLDPQSSQLFHIPHHFLRIPLNMADALKAEGNKAFSAKDYPTAMYVTTPPLMLETLETVADMGTRQ
jgi:hypothetical protein